MTSQHKEINRIFQKHSILNLGREIDIHSFSSLIKEIGVLFFEDQQDKYVADANKIVAFIHYLK